MLSALVQSSSAPPIACLALVTTIARCARPLLWSRPSAGRATPVARPGAEGALRIIGARLAQDFPAENANHAPNLRPLRDALVGDVRPALLVMLGAVALRAADRVRERRDAAAGARGGPPEGSGDPARGRRDAGAAWSSRC